MARSGPEKPYEKAHLGIALKVNPFEGASHAKDIVLEEVGVEAQQPNAGLRKGSRSSVPKLAKRSQPLYPRMVA